MDIILLYRISNDSLLKARNLQSQISQIDLDIKLRQISQSSSSLGIKDASYINKLLDSKIRLANERDIHISTAVEYASDILIHEIDHKVSGYLSIGSMLINSINSFLTIYKVKAHISVTARTKLLGLSYKLLLPEFTYMEVASTIDRLQKQLY